MDLYAKKTYQGQIVQQPAPESAGNIDADLKELKFSISGAMGWAALGVILFLGLVYLKGKYKVNIFGMIKNRRTRKARKRSR